jgi:hypothetical protein
MRETRHLYGKYGIHHRNEKEQEKRPQEYETLQDIPCIYLGQPRQQERDNLNDGPFLLPVLIYGKEPGNPFFCIQFFNFHKGPVALQTHTAPQDMFFALAAQDFPAPFATVSPAFKLPV